MRRPITRRSFLTGAIMVIPMLNDVSDVVGNNNPLNPIVLPGGLEVVDCRLFPSTSGHRFLLEILNSTGKAVDTPAIGIILPDIAAKENYGWATPMQGVLHAHQSTGLIGVPPSTLFSDDQWDHLEVLLCDEIRTTKAEAISGWEVEIAHRLEVLGPNDVVANITVANLGPALNTSVTITGIVRDGENRICGVTVPIYLNSVHPGQTEVLQVRFGPTVNYIANPKNLINAEQGVTVDFSLQPWTSPINPGCAPVMEWNR